MSKKTAAEQINKEKIMKKLLIALSIVLVMSLMCKAGNRRDDTELKQRQRIAQVNACQYSIGGAAVASTQEGGSCSYPKIRSVCQCPPSSQQSTGGALNAPCVCDSKGCFDSSEMVPGTCVKENTGTTSSAQSSELICK